MGGGGGGSVVVQGWLTRRTVLALVAMGLAVITIANDFTAFSVAIPTMETELHASLSTVQWVINAYALIFGVAIVTGGRLADMFGRRRVFLIGTVIFAGFSLACGLAPDALTLIIFRGLMGIGGAMMWPAILGLTFDLLPESRAGLAGGLVIAAAGLGNAIGPLVGGALTQALSWRWIFFVNLPIAGLAAAATLWTIPHDKPVEPGQRLDYAGVATLSIGLIALLLALDFSSSWGWSSVGVELLVAAAVILVLAFAFLQRRPRDNALLPRDVMRNRAFLTACGCVLCIGPVFFGVLIYVPQIMIKVFGYDPLTAGLGLLPMMITYAIVSLIAGPLYARIGARISVTGGAACITAGMVLLAFLPAHPDYVSLLPGLLLLGVGVGFFFSSVTTAGVTALDPARASLAGGVVYMCNVAGGSIGLGITTAIVAAAPSDSADFVGGVTDGFTFGVVLALLATAIAFVGFRRGSAAPAARVAVA
jgi:EmrB/QacA subfamily drug resistance transporter